MPSLFECCFIPKNFGVFEKEKYKFTEFCGSLWGNLSPVRYITKISLKPPENGKCRLCLNPFYVHACVCVCSAGGSGVPHVSCAGWLGVPVLRLLQQVHHRRAPSHREQARGGPRGLGLHDLRPPGGQCVNLQAALFVSARHQALKTHFVLHIIILVMVSTTGTHRSVLRIRIVFRCLFDLGIRDG